MVLESNTLDVLFVKDGQQGEDGKILYTWIKYAKDASGTGITDDPNGAIYIGISYNNESSIESNDPTQYAWTKIQGADGKKGEDAYTIFLENENISFATDENRNPLSEQAYTSGITIMKGAKPVTDFTIGDIAKTQGIAVAKTDTAIAISVVNGNLLPYDSGEIEIPITVGGTVFKKILTWTCAKKGDQGIQGPQGEKGEQGEKGKNGTSVTIINKSITYQLSTSGTTIPTGTWQTSPQTIPEGQYQWTKTSVAYSDGNKTESYSISYHGKNGSDGTSVKTTSASVKYQVGDSGTTKPTGTWQSNVPTVAQGKYLWTQTIVNYSDGNSTESYSVSYRGIDGSNGVNGMNAATIYLYQRATSTPNKPSNTLTYTFSTTKITGTLNNGWSTTIPTGTDAVYVTVASVSSKNDTATIATSAWSAPVVLAQNGKTGSDGKAGLNVATIYLYQRNTSKPSKPSASVTYTFSTGVASGLNNGWSQKIPDGTNPLYVTLATASSNTATDTILSSEWSDVVVMVQNGEDGQDGISPKVSLSKTGDTTTISIVDATGTHTQTVQDGTNGTPGTDGKDGKTSYFHVKYSNDGGKTFTGNSGENTGIYMGSYTDYTEADSTDVKKYNWVKVKGDKGDTGQKGQDGTSIKITSKSVTYQTSTSGTTAPTGTWSTTVPTVNNGQYLWTKTTVQYSDGNKTEAYSVSYKGTNGTNGTSITVSKTEVTYQVSTSGTTAPTGTWSTTMPSCDQGQYLWTKTYVKYSDGKDTTSYSVSYRGVDGEKFSWNLIKYGKGDVKKGFFKDFNKVENGYGELTLTSKKSYQGLYISDGFVVPVRNYPVGSKLIWSYDIMYTKWDFPTGTNHQEFWLGQRYTSAPSGETATGQWRGVTSHSLPVVGQNGCELNKWLHVEAKMAVPEKASDNVGTENKFQFYNSGNDTATVTLRMKNVKLEYGDTATPWSPSQSDLEGRGVSETVQYYLATSQASGVTSSTSGWSTDITTQKLTGDKKYLWNCYQTKYSDGTSESISTPKVIGVYGDKGQKGDNAKNLSITPSSQYFKSTDGGNTFAPNQITITPTLQGDITFGKWQYSIDGGVSFADVVSGQKGLTISNNVLTVGKDSSLYSDAVTMVTFRAVASDSSFYDTCSIAKIYDVSDIGDGRNLLTGVSSYTKDTPFEKTDSRADGWIVYQNIITSIELEAGKKYVLQAKTDGNWAANHDTSGQDPSKKLVTLWLCSDTTNDFFDMRQGYVVFTPTVTAKYKLRVNQYSNGTDAYTIHLWDIKLEKGSSPTGWTPAPEDVQTAILSTKSEISDVSLKVDNNNQAIEQRVEKTTYERELTLVKGDISKANEGLNKWRYEIYPKSLFASEYQGKSTMDVFAKNTNLTPSQSVLINDTDLSIAWNYDNNYIGYALTFVKFSAAKSVAITFAHDDGAHIYLNGKLIGGNDVYNNKGESLTLGFVKGWNCIEVVVNEGASTEGFKLGTTLSALSECQLMNCYYGTPVARQSHITNQLVQNTTDIDGVSTKVSKVTSVIGDNGENFTSFKNDYSDFKLAMDGFKTTVGKTYVTKDDFNGLEIGGVNLFVKSTASRGWWISDTGVLNANGGWGYSDYIDVSGMKNYIASGFTNLGISPATCFYDSNKTFISGVESKNQNSQDSKRKTLPIPSNAKYMRFSFFLVDIDTLKIEQGTKATAYSHAPEDNEINGQNLVSNLPSNWEQGTVTEGSAVGTTYANTKSASAGSIRPKELIPVSGYITISTAYSNQSQKPIRHWIAAYDVNKNYLGVNYVSNSWNSFPRTLDMKDAKYLAIMVGYTDSSAITPSDISKICLKIERGTSATQFTLAPEDVNGKIQSVETIATQTADKFSWLVKSGTSSSNFELTDKTATLVASKINQYGLVTFNGLDDTTKDKINTTTGGNLITVTPANPKSDYGGGQTYNVTGDDKGGRCVQWNSSCASFLLLNSYTPVNFTSSDQLYYDIRVPNWSSTTFDTKLTIWFYNKNKANITSASKTLTLKSTIWNHFTGYLTLPSSSNWGDLYYYIIGLTNPNKQAIGITNDSYIERVNSYATTYAKNAVDWVGQNGTNTNNMYSMISKWANGAVSANTKINGGLIETDSILAKSIAIGDFANYSQLNHATASHFGFTTTDDSGGEWFTVKNMARDIFLNDDFYDCKPGDTFRIEFSISTSMKGNSKAGGTDSNYVGSTIGLYSFSADLSQSSIYYAQRITASANATETAVSSIVTIGAANRLKLRVFLQTESYGNWSGTLKIRNVTVRKMTTGNLIVDGAITANKIATDAIKSRNYISSGCTQGSFLNLSDGSFTSPNLSWDSNGNLIAKNANLSGEITATDGSIGKFKITDQWLITGSGSTCAGLGGSGQAFWAGAENSTVAPFRVDYDGKLVSSNADISGKITATEGTIGKYEITDTCLITGSGSTCTGIGGNFAFWAGGEDSYLAPFRVGYDGQLNIEHIKVHGNQEDVHMTIAKDYLMIQDVNTSAYIGLDGFDFDFANSRIKNGDQGIELYGDTPYIDFHYNNSYNDYTSRIIAQTGWDCLSFTGSILLGGTIYNASGGHYTWNGRDDAYISCGNYSGGNNIYYYANYHAFYVNNDSGSGMMYINTNGVTSRVGFTKTSDERIKKNFESFDDNIIDAYMNIEPVKYQLKQSSNDSYHFGFKAQHIDKVFSDYGDAYNESFDICTSRPIDPDKAKELYGVDDMTEEYGLRYDELIAPTTYMVQHIYKKLESTKGELTKVKQEKADLEVRLQAIEAKLGL